MIHKITLLRHGESLWNYENRFTGWTDVGLTKQGMLEAKAAGNILDSNSIKFDLVYTSFLKRATKTMEICLEEMNLSKIKVKYDWRLNERHYGSLQGLDKIETAKEYGENQVLIWRRSYDIPPPIMDINDRRHPRFDEKYNGVDSSLLPGSESLKDTFNRFIPLWHDDIVKNIRLNKKILIVAHGNSLRALVKYLDNISDKEIVKLNIPTGVPLVYELDSNLKSIKNYFLGDEKAIANKILKVTNQAQSQS